MTTWTETLRAQRVAAKRSIESIELREISAREWRISDSRIPDGDAGSVLGFAEKTAEKRFEVLVLGHGHGIEKVTLRSLENIVKYFARRV